MNRMVLTSAQISEMLEVHPSTIKQWINSGCPVEEKGSKGRGRSHKFFLGDVKDWLCDREVVRYLKRHQAKI